MKKVLWFSRHEMNEAQKNELVKVFGEIQINQVNKTITSAKEIEKEIKNADVVALVAPIDIQQQVLKIAGDKPVITSLTSREFIPDGEGGKQKVIFSHIKWERLVKIDVVKEDLVPIETTSLDPIKVFDPYLYIEIPTNSGGRWSGGKDICMNPSDLDAVKAATTPGELLGGFADDYLNKEDFEIVKRHISKTIIEIQQYLFTKSSEICKWNEIINSDDFICITNRGFSFREKEQIEFKVTGPDNRPTVRMHIKMNLVPDREELVNKLNKYAYERYGLQPLLPSINVNFDDIVDYIRLIAKFATLASYGINPGSNAIELNTGKYLQNDYGKYCSNLTYVVSYENIKHYKFKEDNVLKRTMNVKWDGDPKFMHGKFWKSKKGALCFEPLPEHKATHTIIQLRWGGAWGGAFDSSSGLTTIPNTLYEKRASSNGGGAGYTYYVVEKNTTKVVTEDDF